MPTVRVLDVSHHNAPPNLAGVELLIAKASEGRFADPRYRWHRQNAVSAGVPFGAYLFTRHAMPAAQQLDTFYGVVGAPGPDQAARVVALDVEDSPGNIAEGDCTAHVLALAQGLADRYGTKPLLYTNEPWAAAHLDPHAAELAKFPLWISRYPTKAVDPDPTKLRTRPKVPGPWSSWSLWQYTSNGRQPGSDQPLDVSTADSDTLAALLTGADTMHDLTALDGILTDLAGKLDRLGDRLDKIERTVDTDLRADLVSTKDVLAEVRESHNSERGWLAAIAAKLGVAREDAIALDPSHGPRSAG